MARYLTVEYEAERTEVAAILRRLYERGLTTTSGGNVSRRCSSDRFVITPGALDKGTMTPDSIAVVALDGTNLTPAIRPSSECVMHQRLYERYPAVRAVVHAHPTTACALTCAGMRIDLDLVCETYALVDPPVPVAYARSGSATLAEAVADAMEHTSCTLLQSHGVVTVGGNLLQAFTRMELIEEAARLTFMCRAMGTVRHLSDSEKAELDAYIGRTATASVPDERSERP